MAVTTQEVVEVLASVASLFFASNPSAEEVIAFLTAVAPFVGPGAATSGSIPAFRVNNTVFGPIPFAPVA
jgi:hypothetical protein